MTFSLKTHLKKTSKSGDTVLVRQQPYARLNCGEGPPVFVQHGQPYAEGGEHLTEGKLPDWYWDELAKMTPEARREVGLK